MDGKASGLRDIYESPVQCTEDIKTYLRQRSILQFLSISILPCGFHSPCSLRNMVEKDLFISVPDYRFSAVGQLLIGSTLRASLDYSLATAGIDLIRRSQGEDLVSCCAWLYESCVRGEIHES